MANNKKELEIALNAANNVLEKMKQDFRLKVHKHSGLYHVEYTDKDDERDLSIGTLRAGSLADIVEFLTGFYKVAWMLK